MPDESTASRIAEIEKRLNWKLYCGYSAEAQDDIRFLLKLAKPEPDGWVALSKLDEICCEWGPPEYVMTDDGEACYWRFAGHELPVGDNLGDIISFAASHSPTPPVLPEGEKA